MPRWWVWSFYATIVWGIGYTIAYPAWPLISDATKGVIGYYHPRRQVAADIKRFDDANATIKAQLRLNGPGPRSRTTRTCRTLPTMPERRSSAPTAPPARLGRGGG